MTAICTYVFMDLETSGLPREEDNKTRITELSMIAVKREHLLDTPKGKSPRVQNKLTLCFNPRRMVQPQGTEVTGLSNELLEFEMVFNKNSFELIDKFMNQLTQPVCLIAQNGDNFDYPILKNHLEKLNVYFSCNVRCADCYFGFYDILEAGKNTVKAKNGHTIWSCEASAANASKVDSSEKDNLKTDSKGCGDNSNLESALKNIDTTDDKLNTYYEGNDTMKNFSRINRATDKKCVKKLDFSFNKEKACLPNTTTTKQVNNEAMTNNRKNMGLDNIGNFKAVSKNVLSANEVLNNSDTYALNLGFTEEDWVKDLLLNDAKYIQNVNESTPKQNIKKHKEINLKQSKVKRRFPWAYDDKPKKSYKLAEIYKRQLNREPPEAHRAENDCLMALEIAVTLGEKFVYWVDRMNSDFKDVESMKIGVRFG